MANEICKNCKHWHKDGQGRPRTPEGAVDMSQPVRGFCRGAPPLQQYAPDPSGSGNFVFLTPAYRLLDENWPACAVYEERKPELLT